MLIDKNIYESDDYKILLEYCWKQKSSKTLSSYKKETLIDIIRCLEHNWAGEMKANKVLQARLENVCNHLKDKGYSLEDINNILSFDFENIGDRNGRK